MIEKKSQKQDKIWRETKNVVILHADYIQAIKWQRQQAVNWPFSQAGAAVNDNQQTQKQ